MIFGFFFGVARGTGLCALAVSAAAAAAVPSMNSRRLVDNANSLLHLTAVSWLMKEPLRSVRSAAPTALGITMIGYPAREGWDVDDGYAARPAVPRRAVGPAVGAP
jgi:hypothetical protein